MEESKNKKYLIGAIILVIIIIFGGLIYNKKNASIIGKYDDFAKCLTNKGLIMYGAAWCSHCQNEKNNFEGSFKYATYIECPDNIELCTDKGINGYPTWIDGNGKLYEGEQGLDGLSQISGCELPN